MVTEEPDSEPSPGLGGIADMEASETPLVEELSSECLRPALPGQPAAGPAWWGYHDAHHAASMQVESPPAPDDEEQQRIEFEAEWRAYLALRSRTDAE